MTVFRLRRPERSSPRLEVVPVLLMACILAIGATGCGGVPNKPADSAEKQARQDARDAEREEFEQEHMAPPPAYGNKVVLATQGRESSQSF